MNNNFSIHVVQVALVIVQVRRVLNRNAADWHFNNLSGSPLKIRLKRLRLSVHSATSLAGYLKPVC